jgi:hypothetical protein
MLFFSTKQRATECALGPALHMIARRADRPTAITPGVDKACDTEDFVNELRSRTHIAQNTSGRSAAIDGRTTRHGSYAVSPRIRNLLKARSRGSFSTCPARPLQNCRSSEMRRRQELEPRKTRTLVSSP